MGPEFRSFQSTPRSQTALTARYEEKLLMRARTLNYFFGSLFSRQIVFAYGIAGGITTAIQLGLLWVNYFSNVPNRHDSIPLFLDIYIETLLPIWIGEITAYNVGVVLINLLIALMILLVWTANYAASY